METEKIIAELNFKAVRSSGAGGQNVNKVSSKKDSNLADFLFTITKTYNGIKLKGIEGTAWLDLSFSLTKNKKQAFDLYGMTALN